MKLYSMDEELDEELMKVAKEWRKYSFKQKLKVNLRRPIFLIYLAILIAVVNLFICFILLYFGL